VGLVTLFGLAAVFDSRAMLASGGLLMMASGAYGAQRALRWLASSAPAVGVASASSWAPLGAIALAGVNVAMAGLGALLTFAATLSFSRGRQIRTRGKTLLPPVEASARWLTVDVGVPRALAGETDTTTRAALAAQWRENGRTEHASVAAFARLTLDLVALGAPPSLVSAAQRDALDEIRHAELCFSLARAIDGAEASPAAFPEAARAPAPSRFRTVALASLAVSSLVDGALNEGVSARIVARLARRVEDPALRAILREIAADEGRHAAHGWDVVRFCLAEGGAPVAHALAGAVRALPSRLTSTLAPASRGGAWERWGIPGEALEGAELAKTRDDVCRRVARMIASHIDVTPRAA
jgi:hypothetical protein